MGDPPRLDCSPRCCRPSIALAGCAATVSLEPAPDARTTRHCAEVTVRLPATVGGQERRWTDAQATGAWGDPGRRHPDVRRRAARSDTLPCQTVDGVDWIIDDAEAPHYRVTTFGRTPAVEVYLDNDIVSSADVLDRLSRIVSLLPADDGVTCTDRGRPRQLGRALERGVDELRDELGVGHPAGEPALGEHRDRREARASC